jgi:hypothetical protein
VLGFGRISEGRMRSRQLRVGQPRHSHEPVQMTQAEGPLLLACRDELQGSPLPPCIDSQSVSVNVSQNIQHERRREPGCTLEGNHPVSSLTRK